MYYVNCDQSYFWGDEHTNVLKQKSLGQSIMVSDFADELNGFLQFNSSAGEANYCCTHVVQN